MNVLCAICQDLLVPSNDIFITPCGHVFHFPCLVQWLEKAHNCPECRQKVQNNKITRIYFNFTSAEDVKEDSVTLQQKVDSLSFQVKLKETECKNSINENAVIKKQLTGLREEFKRVESELNNKTAVIRGMREESKYFQNLRKDYEKIKDERDKLEGKMSQYENIRSLICESEEYADRMVNGISDPNTLRTYLSIIKKELTQCMSKRKELRESVRRLQQELQKMKIEKTNCTRDYTKQIDELQEALAISRSENDELLKKIAELKGETTVESDNAAGEASGPCPENTVSRKRGTENDPDRDVISAKKHKGTLKHMSTITLGDSEDSDILFSPPIPVRKPKGNEENSPYLPTKAKSVLKPKDRDAQNKGFSLKLNITKKPGSSLKMQSRQDKVFDGFGGHSRLEQFPLPKSSTPKLKRPISDTSKNKKIKLDHSNNKQMDDFVINLT